MSKLIIEPTEGDALDTHAVKGADNLANDALFFSLGFINENPLARAGVVLEIEDEARELLERELGFHMNPDAPNYRAVTQLTDDLAVQVMLGGIATYSDIERQLFEVDVLRKDSSGELKYWTSSPFLEDSKQVGEMLDAQEVEDLMQRIKAYTD